MKTKNIETKFGRFTIVTPEGFEKVTLPVYNEWHHDLMTTEVPQGRYQLRSPEGDCCLGRLCEIQGRLCKIDGLFHDGNVTEYPSRTTLSLDNPLRYILGPCGNFPPDCYIEDPEANNEDEKKITCFTQCNDWAKMSFKEIAEGPLASFFKPAE